MLFKHYVSIKGQHLKKFCYSTGGGMTGGYYMQIITRQDDKNALISIEEAEFHNEEPKRSEYLVDVSIMDELEDIIRTYRMNFWNRKKFTNMFVCDGESYSYEFEFDKVEISFSSQIYPKSYGDKLSELREAVKEYVGKITP